MVFSWNWRKSGTIETFVSSFFPIGRRGLKTVYGRRDKYTYTLDPKAYFIIKRKGCAPRIEPAGLYSDYQKEVTRR